MTGITLFNGECMAPIHLEDFDGDENLAPYHGSYDDNHGRPSYVMAYDPSYLDESKESFLETFEKNDGSIEYYLVWEKKNFVLLLGLWEDIRVDEKSHTMFPMYLSGIDGYLIYISTEAWPYFKERNNYGYEWFIIYDPDDLK